MKPSNIRHLTPITKRRLLVATFVVYLGVVAALTVVPTHFTRFRRLDSNHVNVIPFGYSIGCYRNAWGIYQDLKANCVMNTLGNIALFLPLGILLPLLSDRFRSLRRLLLLALFLSLSIEGIQFVLRFFGNPRAADIDDVILNTLGGCLGFAFHKYGIQKSEDRIQDTEVRSEKRSSDS